MSGGAGPHPQRAAAGRPYEQGNTVGRDDPARLIVVMCAALRMGFWELRSLCRQAALGRTKAFPTQGGRWPGGPDEGEILRRFLRRARALPLPKDFESCVLKRAAGNNGPYGKSTPM